jgi:hypothetical protein
MINRKLATLGVAGICVALGVSGAAVAKKAPVAPKHATIGEKGGVQFKPNRFVKDKLRWDRDVYRVKSGGTLTVRNNIINEGPHTFTVVKKKDLPKSFDCKICGELDKAHGVDPENQEGPPAFFFLENGQGSQSPPEIDRPGDSALIGPGESKTEKIELKVTAPKGKTLHFMCLVHPWMQAKVIVG